MAEGQLFGITGQAKHPKLVTHMREPSFFRQSRKHQQKSSKGIRREGNHWEIMFLELVLPWGKAAVGHLRKPIRLSRQI